MSAISNSLSSRVKSATNKISSSKLASNRDIRKSISKQNINTLTLNSLGKSTNHQNSSYKYDDLDDPESGMTDPFDNPILLVFILLITFGFIAYGLYNYYQNDTSLKYGQTFYSADILAYEPIFTLDTDKVDNCIDRCQSDSTCMGITYNSDTLTCTGTEDGRLRTDDNNYISWVKPTKSNNLGIYSDTNNNKNNKNKFGVKSSTIIGFANSTMTIKDIEFARPPFNSRFNLSLFIYLNDFYENHGKWRNICCKGTQWPNGEPLDTPYWETIENERPEQCIGVWLTPFNNNLRICITTRRQSSQSSQFQQSLEFVDIQNIPTRKLIHISINMIDSGIEVYLNGKLHRMQTLKGEPMWNQLPMTIFGQTSTSSAIIMDLVYLAESANLDNIKAQTHKLNEYSEKIIIGTGLHK